MAAEYSATLQTIQPGADLLFTEAPVPCNRGLIYHRDGSGLFRLASPSIILRGYGPGCGCGGFGFRGRMPEADYLVNFHGNIQIPTGGTAGEPISLAIAIDGEVDPASIMTVTPAALEEAWNVGTGIVVSIPWICRCESVAVRNVSTQAIQALNGNITFNFAGVRR